MTRDPRLAVKVVRSGQARLYFAGQCAGCGGRGLWRVDRAAALDDLVEHLAAGTWPVRRSDRARTPESSSVCPLDHEV